MPCHGPGLRVARPTTHIPKQGDKMGKNKESKGMGDGRLAGGRQQSKAGGLLGSFLYMGLVAVSLLPAGLVSVSVRSLTAHTAHTGREQCVGLECGDGGGDDGERGEQRDKKRGRSVRCYHAPAPAGRMNLTYLSRQLSKFQS